MRIHLLRKLIVVSTILFAFASNSQKSHAQGTDYYWNILPIGTSTSGTWSSFNLWNSSPSGGPGVYNWANTGTENANFGRTAGTVTLTQNEIAYKINFLDVSGYVLTGSTLTLSNSAGGTGIINTNTFNATISSQILGSVGMNKNGTGTLTLSGSNSYTGTTNINAGALSITSNSALGATGAGNGTAVTSGAALQLSNGITVSELLTLNGTGISSAGALENLSGSNTYSGAITLGSASRINSDAGLLTISGGISGTQNLTLGGAGNTLVNSIIGTSTGTLTKDGSGTVTLSGANSYTGSTTVSAGTLQAGAANSFAPSSNYTLANVAGATLSLNGFNQSIASIAGGGTTGGTLALGVNNLTLTGTTSTTFAGSITGSGSITKNNTGTFTISGTNSWTGALNLSGGAAVVISSSNALGSSGLVTLDNGTLTNSNASNNANFISTTRNITLGANGGTLSYTVAGNTSILGSGTVISGTLGGAFNKAGAGTLAITTAATYDGATNVTAGTLTQVNSNTLPSATALSISSGATYNLGSNLNLTVGSLAGAGTLNIPGGTFTVGDANSTAFSGSIQGSTGTFLKVGTGTLTLSGSGTFTGGTTVNEGTLSVTSALGMGAATNPLTVNNPNVGAGTDVVVNLSSTVGTTTGNLNGTLATPGSGTNTATINTGAGQTYTVNQTAAGSFDGVIGGTGNFALGSSSTNTLSLNGSNTYTGTTTLSGGTLSISNLQNGGVASNIGTNSSIILDGGNLLYTGASQSTDRVITLTNNGGTINSSGTGVMTFSNSSALGMTGSSPRTLTLTGPTGTTTAPNVFAGSIVNGTGETSLTKTGTGVWNLTGASTYTGATNINAGTLVVSGTTGKSTFNVNNSGTLTGTGTIGGPVNVNAGGTLVAGDGTTPLTVNNSVNINGIFDLTVDAGSLTNNRIVSNSLKLNNATLSVNFSGTLAGTEEFLIAQNVTPGTTAVTGTFAGLPNGTKVGNFGGKDVYIYYDTRLSGTNFTTEMGSIIFTPVPEPVSVVGIAALAVGCVGGVLRRRARRANSVAVVSTPIA